MENDSSIRNHKLLISTEYHKVKKMYLVTICDWI